MATSRVEVRQSHRPIRIVATSVKATSAQRAAGLWALSSE